jgi:hypothetical protein
MSLPAVSPSQVGRHRADRAPHRAQWRRCALRGEGLRGAADWIEFYRRFWEQQFDKLDAFLKRATPKPTPTPKLKPSKGKRHGRRA